MVNMLDEQVVALAKAIRQHETGNRQISGATGEMASRYQFLPSTWQSEARRLLGDANAPLTLENENKVAYLRIKEWKNKGYNPGQIASMWNSGNPDMFAKGNRGVGQSSANPNVQFNVPKYVDSVYGLYQQYKPAPFQEIVPEERQLDVQSAEMFGATFPANTVNPSTLKESLKLIGNIPKSLWNFGKGVVNFVKETAGVVNPVGAVQQLQKLSSDIGTMIEEGKQGQPVPSFFDIIAGVTPVLRDAFVPKIIQDVAHASGEEINRAIGQNNEADKAWQEVQRTLVNDPMNILPAALTFEGLIRGTPAGKTFDNIVKKVAKPVIDATKKTFEGAKKTTGFAASQITGLNPETIAQVIARPDAFSKTEMAKLDRPALAERVKIVLDKRLTELRETGKEYNEIRKSSAVAEVSPSEILKVFDKYGIKFNKNGKIIRDAETPPLKPGDITAFEDFQRIFGRERFLSSNAFLNARTTLSEMAKYDATKTQLSNVISGELRRVYDATGKKQIPGLNELDIRYAPEVKELKQLKKDYLKSDGTLKDGALNKIANLTGKGKDQVLGRLENLMPGIAEEIRILKAVEDIQTTGGQKVGTYMRAGVTGGLLVTGNPLIAVAQLLLSQPSVVIPILRAFGKARGISIKAIDIIIDKLKNGIALTTSEKSILNQSIDDIVKNITNFTKEAAKSEEGFIKNPLIKADDLTTSISKAKASGQSLIEEAKKYSNKGQFLDKVANVDGKGKSANDVYNLLKQAERVWDARGIGYGSDVIKVISVKDIVLAEKPLAVKPLAGRKVTEPIEITYIDGKPTLVDGRHRLDQAIANREKTIKVKIR